MRQTIRKGTRKRRESGGDRPWGGTCFSRQFASSKIEAPTARIPEVLVPPSEIHAFPPTPCQHPARPLPNAKSRTPPSPRRRDTLAPDSRGTAAPSRNNFTDDSPVLRPRVPICQFCPVCGMLSRLHLSLDPDGTRIWGSHGSGGGFPGGTEDPLCGTDGQCHHH